MADTDITHTARLSGFLVRDRTTRIFHWVNVITVISLTGIGIVILNAKTLGAE